jgi:hypothetical protein
VDRLLGVVAAAAPDALDALAAPWRAWARREQAALPPALREGFAARHPLLLGGEAPAAP